MHLNFYEIDYQYESPRKNEIIYTIAKAYYKLSNKKLKFSLVNEDSLRQYVTSKGSKYYDVSYTLMNQENIRYIEDIVRNKEKEIKDKQISDENEKLKKIDDKKLGENLISEKDNYDINLDTDKNPFKGALIGGVVAYGTGVAATWGSVAACILFDSVYLLSATGELLTAGFTFFGGLAATGIGFVVAIPSLLGFGVYKIYQMTKDKRRKEFFDNFKSDKMKVEKEVQLYVISKIDNYFTKFIPLEDQEIKLKIKECEKIINSIMDIYINIDNSTLGKLLDKSKDELMKKINEDNYIILKNIPKIRQGLMGVILGLNEDKAINIFDAGVPLFKEFIKNFGPLHTGKETEKKIDNYIEEILSIMKKLLLEKLEIAFNKFDAKHFLKSFDSYLCKKYKERKEIDDKTEYYFVCDCNDFLITPVGDMNKNYGVLSLFFKFSIIIQNLAINRRESNYNQNKEKILQLNK